MIYTISYVLKTEDGYEDIAEAKRVTVQATSATRAISKVLREADLKNGDVKILEARLGL